MILKEIDDRREILQALNTLLKHPKIYQNIKRKIRYEIANIKKGWENERKCAYYIDTYYKDRKLVYVIHDLRIELDDIRVQIDHLIITHFDITILESKYFSSNLHYNEENKEFYIKTKNGEEIGIENPIKQAERQKYNFSRVIRAKKLFLPPQLDYYVLVSPSVRFKGKMPERILKADTFIDKFREEDSKLSKFFKDLLSVRFKVKNETQKLLDLHKPLTVDYFLRKFNLEWSRDWLNREMFKEKDKIKGKRYF